jgi:hypothetical protein
MPHQAMPAPSSHPADAPYKRDGPGSNPDAPTRQNVPDVIMKPARRAIDVPLTGRAGRCQACRVSRSGHSGRVRWPGQQQPSCAGRSVRRGRCRGQCGPSGHPGSRRWPQPAAWSRSAWAWARCSTHIACTSSGGGGSGMGSVSRCQPSRHCAARNSLARSAHGGDQHGKYGRASQCRRSGHLARSPWQGGSSAAQPAYIQPNEPEHRLRMRG